MISVGFVRVSGKFMECFNEDSGDCRSIEGKVLR